MNTNQHHVWVRVGERPPCGPLEQVKLLFRYKGGTMSFGMYCGHQGWMHYDVVNDRYLDVQVKPVWYMIIKPPTPDTAIQRGNEGQAVQWPKQRDVGRIGDMSLSASLRLGLDAENDVYVAVTDERGMGSVEFCFPGSGGGKSPRTREALIALMVAIEADNADDPGRDWWERRMVFPKA